MPQAASVAALSEIGAIGEDDVRRLAAELEADALQVALPGILHQQLADGAGAGERDHVDVVVERQRLARFARRNPGTTLRTPGGRPASSASSPILSAVSGDCSAGFSMTELPIASAGAIFHIAISSGKFHGTMAPIDAQRLVHDEREAVRSFRCRPRRKPYRALRHST